MKKPLCDKCSMQYHCPLAFATDKCPHVQRDSLPDTKPADDPFDSEEIHWCEVDGASNGGGTP